MLFGELWHTHRQLKCSKRRMFFLSKPIIFPT